MFELCIVNLLFNDKIVFMKKLKLSFRDLDNTEVLTREQLKKIVGGSGSSGCNNNNSNGSHSNSGGTCAYYLPHGSASGGSIVNYNVSLGEACTMINGVSGARYCCDGCGSASWYGG